ncbi:glycoside hydrolase family 92 protein [Moniliophthora roreri MCA 2997]|uniref:Glycoside hydrolase family 92 protein n=1 Tax=Moniliophthora roreri (strain MCA 2997) TaxID=1381753 RepID=V2XZQ6_MONRO|nr:glycoside hydrolase family 92 protein [Moniliophthora roreri MCA 2997]
MNPVFGTTTAIKSTNFGEGNIHVKGVKVDGEMYKLNFYLECDIFERGAVVELELTDDTGGYDWGLPSYMLLDPTGSLYFSETIRGESRIEPQMWVSRH